ncbi:pseudouridine synthase [Prolixibacteraceae bacterium JC049]|nr:pseudouridine synthase [Prolixibacteraceae bacterium JC049]
MNIRRDRNESSPKGRRKQAFSNSGGRDERKQENRGRRSFDREEGDEKPRNPKGRFGKSRSDRFEDRKKPSFKGADRKDGFTGKRKEITHNRATEKPVSKAPISKNTDGKIRLNRFLANAGVCSRREADTYIQSGVVTVNGKVVTEMGMRVDPSDDVRFDGTKLCIEKKRYVLLNKPKGFVTTTDDPNAERTVMDLVKHVCDERIYPVGRLDKDTTGLLLLTNDGDLTKKLTHPSHNKKKIYHVHLHKDVEQEDLRRMLVGFDLEDGYIAADEVSYVDQEDKRQVGIEIHSGRNRIVRRIFAHLGYRVVRLDRVYFAGLTKKNLPRGKWRFLTPGEMNILNL